MLIDRFTPMTVIQKIDEIRDNIRKVDMTNPPTHLTHQEWHMQTEGMQLALAWIKVEILNMAFDLMRHVE